MNDKRVFVYVRKLFFTYILKIPQAERLEE